MSRLQNNNYNEYLRDFYEFLPRKWSCKDLLIEAKNCHPTSFQFPCLRSSYVLRPANQAIVQGCTYDN